ncbi:zinc knuckle CX2CX4HX4C containing protein [Tanacetum coccineum]
MCTYLKNMEGYKLNDLKLKDFDYIQEMFDRAFKRQKVEDDKETAELKQLMKIIPDEEEVAIDAIPLVVKSPSIVGWKIYKEGRKCYYQIMRDDGKSQMYMFFSEMLKKFNREDLEDLYKLVKAKFESTKPVEDLDLLFWGDLKTMFEPHVEDAVWRNQQAYKVLDWKLYDSYRVHSLRMQHVHIYMLVEKKYPLTPLTVSMMLEKKLMIDYESEMAYQLCKFIMKQLKKFREMDAGFLLGNNAAKKGGLASKLKNIEGKLLDKDGKPLKLCLKNASSKPIQVKPVGEECKKSMGSVTKLVSDSCAMKPTLVATKTESVHHLKKEAVTRVPVWVRILNVPVVAFSKAGLSLIATQLGRPIRLDACTSDMCLNPWGHTSYARVLVEFNSENEWPPRCSKCRIFDHEDYDGPLLSKQAKVVSSSREGGIQDTDGMHKKKGTNKAVKSTQGFRFSKPKTNLIYRPVSKSVTTKEHADKPNDKVSSSKEGANGANKESSVSSLVTMNDSSGSKNDTAYIQDDINLVQLRRNMDRLMDEDSVLELNSNNEKVSVIDTNSVPSANVVVSNNKSAPAEVKESDKGSLLKQFRKAREASTSKHISSMSDSDESEVEEVCMPDVIPGGGFLNGLEDDLE